MQLAQVHDRFGQVDGRGCGRQEIPAEDLAPANLVPDRAGLDDRAQRTRDAALLSDHLADVVGSDVHFEHQLPVLTLQPLDAHLVGIIDQLAGQVGEDLLQPVRLRRRWPCPRS